MITVVDYGVGNIGALLNIFEFLGLDATASGDASAVARAAQLVLPGVGAFDKAMSMLSERGLRQALDVAVLERRVPVLGVCLGMQLLARGSEEGNHAGLAWIAADVIRIVPVRPELRVPHIGWAEVRPRRSSPLFPVTTTDERFYFVHGYVMRCDEPADVVATVDYGEPLTCAVARGNICGVQFHPEKSHRYGMRLLSDWARGSFACGPA